MKNHISINGKLLQTNKKWIDLKLSQKEYISNLIRNDYLSFIQTHNKAPNKMEKEELINGIYEKIREKEIWIPFFEIKKQFISKTSKIKKLPTK